ncbi:MAG: hypothetical protein J6J59_08850, partial [Peptococcaceae bacterium]|nr:hypothetical protein [Peptococcaceae bacterium]
MEAKMKNSNAGNVHLLDFLNEDPELQKIRQLLQDDNEVSVYGLYEGQRMLVTASLAKQYSQKNLLVVCDTEKRAKELWEDFAQLLTAHEVLYFPALEMIPYEVIAQSGDLEKKRLEVLAKLTLEKQKQFAVI